MKRLQNGLFAPLCSMNGLELKQWREQQGLSQRDLALKLEVSDSAVNRWEGGQDIPGPAQLLLGMLIHGKIPFGKTEDTSAEEAKHFWSLKLSLADWHKLESMASAAGFSSVRDYLLLLIQEQLRSVHSATEYDGCHSRKPSDDPDSYPKNPQVYQVRQTPDLQLDRHAPTTKLPHGQRIAHGPIQPK